MEPAANDPAVASARPRQLLRLYLTLAAAYVDILGFIGLFGLFTAQLTGNFVLIGSELVNRNADVPRSLLVAAAWLSLTRPR